MRGLSRRTLVLASLLVAACRLESHPPPGVPADEAAIRSAVAAWFAKSEPWSRVLRTEVHQDRDLASVWAVSSPATSEGDGDGERATLFVLRREPGGWTVEYHGSPTRPRP